MSDYDPRPPGPKREPLRAPEVEPVTRNSGVGGFYLVGGVLVALVLVAGLLFFNPATAPGERTDQANQPAPAPTVTPTVPMQRQ
ncbi:MAG: hypothetical protein ACT4O6_11300 [Reyranella sp.]